MAKRNTPKTESKTKSRIKAILKKGETVNVDKLVEEKKTTGTDFQAYMRDCIKAGKVL